MQAILNERQTELILSIIAKITEDYFWDPTYGKYTPYDDRFSMHFDMHEFQLLQSLLNIFEQSHGVTFCRKVPKLNL